MRIEESTLVVHLEPNAADESQPAMQNMLKHVGEGGARSIRFNGFPLAAIEFIRWAGEGPNPNPPSTSILNPTRRDPLKIALMTEHRWELSGSSEAD